MLMREKKLRISIWNKLNGVVLKKNRLIIKLLENLKG